MVELVPCLLLVESNLRLKARTKLSLPLGTHNCQVVFLLQQHQLLLPALLYFQRRPLHLLKVNNIKRSLSRSLLLPPLAPVLCSKLSPEEHRKYCKRQVNAYLVPTHSDLSKLLQALRFLPPKHLQ